MYFNFHRNCIFYWNSNNSSAVSLSCVFFLLGRVLDLHLINKFFIKLKHCMSAICKNKALQLSWCSYYCFYFYLTLVQTHYLLCSVCDFAKIFVMKLQKIINIYNLWNKMLKSKKCNVIYNSIGMFLIIHNFDFVLR